VLLLKCNRNSIKDFQNLQFYYNGYIIELSEISLDSINWAYVTTSGNNRLCWERDKATNKITKNYKYISQLNVVGILNPLFYDTKYMAFKIKDISKCDEQTKEKVIMLGNRISTTDELKALTESASFTSIF
jgi:hypothetical protein